GNGWLRTRAAPGRAKQIGRPRGAGLDHDRDAAPRARQARGKGRGRVVAPQTAARRGHLRANRGGIEPPQGPRFLRNFRPPTSLPMKMLPRASRGFTLVEIMIVVVIIGLLAAMAIPAFQKVRTSSQDKTVLNNARQLSAAADQYYLENGVSSVDPTSLVGPTNYVKSLNLVASETYPTAYTQGVTITIAGVAGQRTITYAP